MATNSQLMSEGASKEVVEQKRMNPKEEEGGRLSTIFFLMLFYSALSAKLCFPTKLALDCRRLLLPPSNGTFSINERSQREQYCLRINCRQDLSTQIPQNDSHYTITWFAATKTHSTLFLHFFEGGGKAVSSSLGFEAAQA